MKHQFFLGFLLLCICSSHVSFAQNPLLKETRAEKSSVFAKLPAKSVCNRFELEKVIHSEKSSHISLTFTDNLVLSGEVIEKVETAAGTKNVNIRLSDFGNALLNISFLTQPDNTYKIIGRIIHPKNADALIIAEENGKYYITKYKMEFFMVE